MQGQPAGVEFAIAADVERRLTKALGIYDEGNDIAWPAVIIVDSHGKVGWVDVPDSYVKDSRPAPAAILDQVGKVVAAAKSQES